MDSPIQEMEEVEQRIGSGEGKDMESWVISF